MGRCRPAKSAGRLFELRRARFPRRATTESFVVDLLENLGRAGLDPELAHPAVVEALKAGRFSGDAPGHDPADGDPGPDFEFDQSLPEANES